jgi:ketosteroid isomerase-like protein
MSSENVDLVRRGFEALSESGVEGLLPFIHPEFAVTTPPNLASEPDTYRGQEGVRRYFDSFYDAMDDIRFEPDEFLEVGERVVVPFTLRARGRTSGIEVEQHAVQVWEFRDDLAIRVQVYATLAEALDATQGGEPADD